MRECPSKWYGDGFITAINILIEAICISLHIIDYFPLQILNYSIELSDGASKVVIIDSQ